MTCGEQGDRKHKKDSREARRAKGEKKGRRKVEEGMKDD